VVESVFSGVGGGPCFFARVGSHLACFGSLDVWFGVVLCDDGEVSEVCDGLGRLYRGPSFRAGKCGGNGSGDLYVVGGTGDWGGGW
jgi:hypothetical protein